MANNPSKGTITHIRTIYSDQSYITIKFYNNALSMNFVPAIGKNSNGLNQYQKPTNPGAPVGQMTTLTYDLASTVSEVFKTNISQAIANNTDTKVIVPLNNAELVIERRSDEFNQKRVFITLNKQNTSIPFKFAQVNVTVNENGNQIQKPVEGGLMMFMKTIDGYLTGINADRHLDKLTEDFAKSQQGNQDNKPGGQNQGYNNNYNKNRNPNYRNNYNKNNRYNNNYQNNQNNQQDTSVPWETGGQPAVGISSYSIE